MLTPKEVESMLTALHVGPCAITSQTAKKIGISKCLILSAIAHGKIPRIGRGVIDRAHLAKWISETPFAAAKLCEKIQPNQ
jgi:hypothetical protein